MSVTPSGATILTMRPEATGLRTKRTKCAAARSAVKRPRPRTSAGSSRRRRARPTHFIPEPAVALAMTATLTRIASAAHVRCCDARRGVGGPGWPGFGHGVVDTETREGLASVRYYSL